MHRKTFGREEETGIFPEVTVERRGIPVPPTDRFIDTESAEKLPEGALLRILIAERDVL